MNIPSRYDYTGQKFWNLTAIKPIRVGGRHRGIVWLWKCDCGTEIERVAHDIKRGHQKSCGCLKIESTRQRASKPEGVAAFHLLYTSYKFKAEDRGYSFDLSKEEFRNITVQNCYYCGRGDLGLDGGVASISDVCKKEIFDILKTPRPDGTNAADDLIKAFTSGDQQEAQKFLLKMFSDKIPGTETTYITAVSRVQEKANQGLSAAMGTATFERFKSMNIKPENIETGFDPWSEYLQQKGK